MAIDQNNKKQFIRIRGANENNLKNLNVCRRTKKIYGIFVILCPAVSGTDGEA